MGRPPIRSGDDFLDAAAQLFSARGSRALTMNAVARAIRAPSGSIYHRYPDRAALLAALWLRTARNFQCGYFKVLGDAPTPSSAVRTAVWTVDWCRGHVPDAVVLEAGVRTFEPDEWNEAARHELAMIDNEVQQRITDAVRALTEQTGRPADQISFAMVDLPLAAVRRHLLAGKAPPKRTTTLVREVASLILAGPAG